MAFFRSLIERREVMGRAAWISNFLAGGSDSGYGVTDSSALSQSIIFGCIQVRSQDMAKMPLRINARGDDDERRPAREHPLWNIFSVAANPFMTAYVYRQTTSLHLATRGNAYSLIERDYNGQVSALWPRNPALMRPKIERGQLFYRWEGQGGTKEYSASEVFHLMGMSRDGITGMSPVEVFAEGIGLAAAQQKQVAKSMEQGSRIPYAIEMDKDIGLEKAIENAEAFRKHQGGPENAGKVPVMYGGMTLKALGFSSKDAEMLDSRRFSNEECCRIWRVPPYKVMDFLRATFSNVTETNISYVNDTLRPEQEMWEQAIKMQLMLPEEWNNLYAEFDNRDMLKGTPKERAEVEAIQVGSGVSGVDEVRRGYNWRTVPGGNRNLVNGAMIPLEDVGKQYPDVVPQNRENA